MAWAGPGSPSPGPSAASRDLARSLKGAPALAPLFPHHSPGGEQTPASPPCRCFQAPRPRGQGPRHPSLGSPRGSRMCLPVATGQRLTRKGAEHHDGEAGPRSGWETGLKSPRTQTQVPETVLTRGPGALPAHFTSTSSPPPFQAHPVAPFPSPASGPRPVPDTHTSVTARSHLDPSRWRRGTGSE